MANYNSAYTGAQIDAAIAEVGNKANATHIHAQSDVTDLSTALGNKVDKVEGKGLSTEDYTSTEKTKLANIATGATKNNTDAALLNRANHTGKQSIDTLSDFPEIPAATTVVNSLTSTSTTSALSAAQGKILNDTKAKLETGSYVGTGTRGTQTLVFQFNPKLVIVGLSTCVTTNHPAVELILIYPTTTASPLYLKGTSSLGGKTKLNVTWSDNSVSWSSNESVEQQYNANDMTYYYIALG